MMKENNNIFLADGDALVYLAIPIHRKYSTTFFGAIHFVRTYLRTNFLTSLFLVSYVGIWSNCFCRRVVPKKSFKDNRTYELNNITQMLQVNKTSNIKYNVIHAKLN